MDKFDITKYLKENQLGSYGILNHYVDLQPLKEEEETELDTVVPYEGPEDQLTGMGDGDTFEQDEIVSEEHLNEMSQDMQDLVTMLPSLTPILGVMLVSKIKDAIAAYKEKQSKKAKAS